MTYRVEEEIKRQYITLPSDQLCWAGVEESLGQPTEPGQSNTHDRTRPFPHLLKGTLFAS